MKVKLTKVAYLVNYWSSLLVSGQVNKVSYLVPNVQYLS
jgi:hypothetical protein